jgi:LuxR family maltose regulon positive regulatory protein
MLGEAKKIGIAPSYIQRILAMVHSDSTQTHPPASIFDTKTNDASGNHIDGLIEPLSNREIEVLASMALGLSNAEIATKLFLSPNTLKSHTQNIFGKLGVHSRVQAVNKARLLKLIN